MTSVNTVVVVDEHELIRQGLAHAFDRHADFDVVGEAGSVTEGAELIGALKPTVVVTDVRLPDGTGLDLVRQLRSRDPEVGIVVLTMYAGDEQLFEALEAGASAFVAKDAPSDDVVAAVKDLGDTVACRARSSPRVSPRCSACSPRGSGWRPSPGSCS